MKVVEGLLLAAVAAFAALDVARAVPNQLAFNAQTSVQGPNGGQGLALGEAAGESPAVVKTLRHAGLPAHTLRFVEPPSSICEQTKGVRSWSGYLDVDLDALWEHEGGDKLLAEDYTAEGVTDDEPHPKGVVEHFWFWAFESRSGNAAEDPVVMWLNGGPGCSSGCGMLMELGPCNARPYNGTKGPHTHHNEFSWNNNASLLFLDQPVGTGFSYASWADESRNTAKDTKAPSRIYTAKAAARDASAFLQLWALHATELFGDKNGLSSFHIAGESYAGRWIPLIANQLVQDNKEAVAHPERGLAPLPLDSVLIGNGITSPKHQFPAYVEYACANTTGFGTFVDEAECDRMYSRIPTCLSLVEKCNTPTKGSLHDRLACKTALDFCEEALQTPYYKDGRSSYDYMHYGDYEEDDWFAHFLNDTATKKALGVDKKGAGDSHDGTFASCSDDVYNRFAQTGDGAKDSMWAVKALLESDVRVLLYAGGEQKALMTCRSSSTFLCFVLIYSLFFLSPPLRTRLYLQLPWHSELVSGPRLAWAEGLPGTQT